VAFSSTVGRFGERRDKIVRCHAVAGVGPPGEWRDPLRARLLPGGAVEGGGGGADERRKARRQQPGGAAQRGKGGKTAPPVAAGDLCAEIGRPVDTAGGGAQAVDPAERLRHAGRLSKGTRAEAAGGAAAGQFQTMIVAQEHADGASFSNRRLPPGAGSRRCGGQSLKSN
jgi:hypothetical protein